MASSVENKAVVSRFMTKVLQGGLEITQAGKEITARGMTYYKLADGKIVEDDTMTSPDLAQMLAPQMAQMANA